MDQTRYRCTACGNLTRFDVTVSRLTREFHHFSVGGALEIEQTEILDETVDEILCRWCGHGNDVVRIDREE
ncbi:MAG: hypothetical protein O3C27_11375 [Actinomycetota bacterium]|nr:hypothetical protein [Actinomycetota bacterium]